MRAQYDASQNRIVSLPSLARCVALQHVDLSFNCLSAFPEGLVAAQQLSYLDLSSNMVRNASYLRVPICRSRSVDVVLLVRRGTGAERTSADLSARSYHHLLLSPGAVH
jgi:hypothetical protein